LEEYNFLNEKYSRLVSFFDNPISEANEIFTKQLAHYADISQNYVSKLQSGVDESCETLQDLYVAPYFKIYGKNFISEQSSEFVAPSKKEDINTFLNGFILNNELPENLRDNYNMIFILGQPGQGKTSLCYKLVFDILTKTHGLPDSPLFFIKIRELHTKDFINDTFNTLKKAIQQNIKFDTDKCILILDGLDEAYMNGILTDNDLKNLYERLNKASRHNSNLKIILTSRLNYLDVKDPSLEGSLIVKMDVFEDTQIRQYLENFAGFYPDNSLVKSIPEILDNSRYLHIAELLQQPVLMYFVALTNINVEENDSKAVIYNKIFHSLAKRSWDKNGQLKHIKPELQHNHEKYSKYLRQYIRSLAFEIYQSPQLHITVTKLISLNSTQEFIRKCFNDSISGNAEAIKEISKYLLVSFYFQSSNQTEDGDAAIEFFHNSLWEYLTAEYMWEENKRIILNRDADGDLLPVRLEEYCDNLKKLIGNKYFASEIRANLENIILIENNEVQDKILEQTKEVFNKLVERQMLLTYDWNIEKLNPRDKMQNIFELAWTLYYWNNCNKENLIVTTAEFNDFFFNPQSNSPHQTDLINIHFAESCLYEQYITHCNVKNVTFDYGDGLETLNLYFSTFLKTTFTRYLRIAHIVKNEFEDVVFEEMEFNIESNIHGNTFKNVELKNIEVPDIDWLDKLIEKNTVDENFIKNHKITAVTSDINGKETIKYYVNYMF
jgi:hypothetical protein